MQNIPIISTDSLREKLSSGEAVNIIDIRPIRERSEWFIPGSLHIDAYDKLRQNDPTALSTVHLDKSVPVITVCAAGKTSMLAADVLRQKGYKAYSLQDGMKGWSLAWNYAYREFEDFKIWQIRRTGKGCLSYIIASGNEAIIIDASLPAEVYLMILNQYNLSVKYVAETHIHADHLSRSREIASYFHAPLFLPAPNKVQFPFMGITADTTFSIGTIILRTLATPGHTLESHSFYIENRMVFTGDTLFINGVGRPDLKATVEETRNKASLLYKSLKKLLLLPDSVLILPAHTNKPVEFNGELICSEIGEAKKNIKVLENSESDFVDFVLKNIPPAPANYLAIVENNIKGDYSGINPVDLEAGANRCAIS